MENRRLWLILISVFALITGAPSHVEYNEKPKEPYIPSSPSFTVAYPIYLSPFLAYISYPVKPPPSSYPVLLYPLPGYVPMIQQHWSPAPTSTQKEQGHETSSTIGSSQEKHGHVKSPASAPSQQEYGHVTIVDDKDTHTSLLEYPTKESNNSVASILTELMRNQLVPRSLRPLPPSENITPCLPQHCTVAETLLHYTDPTTYCLTDIMQNLIYYGQQDVGRREQLVIDQLIEKCEENNMRVILPNSMNPNIIQIYEDILQNKETKAIRCAPREKIIPFSVNGDVIYKPECYNTTICSGCCTSDLHQCLPTKTRKISKMVHVFKKKPIGAKPGMEMEYLENREVQVDEHLECDVQCKVKKCNAGQKYYPRQCECRCKKRRSCRSGKRWNEQKCRCECSEQRPCSTGRSFSNRTCRCVRKKKAFVTLH